ncbi:MAG: DUF3048 domain-containing protein [Acidimicrobiales bacterium]
MANHSKGSTHRLRQVVLSVGVVLLLAIILLAGAEYMHIQSTGGGHAPKPTHPKSTQAATQTGAKCPLSGELAPGGKVPARPALAVTVDNYPTARPQRGIQDADIVFEQPVEAFITRWVVVFQCHESNLVGDIRSARYMDLGILSQLSKPLYAHAGAIIPTDNALAASSNLIDENVFSNPQVIQHLPGRYAPYDTFASTSALWGLHPNDRTPPLPLFAYSAASPRGSSATQVHIPISSYADIRWQYDSHTKQYLLSYSGQPAMLADGNQISAANVVVQFVRVYNGPYVEDAEGAYGVRAHFTGSGPLIVFRNGIEVKGTWSRSSQTSPTRLLASNGSVIKLQPGLTWVEITPSTVHVTTASAAVGSTGTISSGT